MKDQTPMPLVAQPTMSIVEEPVFNAINSLALLNRIGRLPALPRWIRATAAALSPEDARTNLLVVGALHNVLPIDGDWSSLPAYLADLETRDASRLRDDYLELLTLPSPSQGHDHVSPEGLLNNRELYIARVTAMSSADDFDEALHTEAWTLLQEPGALLARIIGHLRMMWDRFLAAEWKRTFTNASREVSGLRYRLSNEPIVAENFRRYLEQALATDPQLAVHRFEEVRFVPTPHVGRYQTFMQRGPRLWVFFDATRNFAVLMRTSPIERAELLLRLGGLGDEARLGVLEMFAEQDEIAAQEIITRLDLSQSSVSRHLKQLSPYLVESRGDGANKRYRLSPAQIDLTFRAVKQILDPEPRPSDAPDLIGDAGDLRRFMDRQGRITQFPVRSRDKLLVLEYVVTRFEPGLSYTEKEVNDVINRQISFGDFVTLRRALVDEHFLGRTRDGSRYWRVPAQVS